jgi:hypothetical protein
MSDTAAPNTALNLFYYNICLFTVLITDKVKDNRLAKYYNH